MIAPYSAIVPYQVNLSVTNVTTIRAIESQASKPAGRLISILLLVTLTKLQNSFMMKFFVTIPSHT